MAKKNRQTKEHHTQNRKLKAKQNKRHRKGDAKLKYLLELEQPVAVGVSCTYCYWNI